MNDLSRSNRSREKNYADMNSRLNNRELIDINIVNNNRKNNRSINRLDVERDEFLKNSNNENDSDSDNNNLPTNQINFDRRMPMRPEFNISKPEFDNNYFPPTMQDLKKKVHTFFGASK